MSNMLEKVAEAIAAEMAKNAEGYTTPEEIARAALLALREPDEGMLHAGFVAMNETPGGQWKRMKAEGVTPRRMFDVKMVPRWQAMIDQALRSER